MLEASIALHSNHSNCTRDCCLQRQEDKFFRPFLQSLRYYNHSRQYHNDINTNGCSHLFCHLIASSAGAHWVVHPRASMGAPQRQTSIAPSTFTDRRFSMAMLMGAGTAANKAPLPAAVARARQRVLQDAFAHPHASPEKPVLDHRKWHGAAQQYLVSPACSISLFCIMRCMQLWALVFAPCLQSD